MRTLKVYSDKVFFTADLHFWHNNIIRFANRPYKNVEKMHEDIIKRWNEKIPTDATVSILGDVSWKGIEDTQHLLDQLNGNKILIIGNHDPDSIINYFNKAYDMLGLRVIDVEEGGETYCHLCHYPLHEWNRDRHGSINLHGHCHGSNDDIDKHNCKRLDVGVDSYGMNPLSWDDIKVILNKRNLKKS